MKGHRRGTGPHGDRHNAHRGQASPWRSARLRSWRWPTRPPTLEAERGVRHRGPRAAYGRLLRLDAAGSGQCPGWIEADDFLETSVPGVYAIGDVIGPRRIMLAHMAVAEAHTAVHNILHPEDRKAQRYDVVPSAIFTAPEIGDVGLSEAQAKQQGFAVKTSVFQFRELGKAQAMGELAGLFAR
ncbi:MAG: FAD-dependent oxidoreductase [Bilophila wadsworthia]